MKKQAWYSLWFNSPYYRILYNNRSESEAKLFVDAIAQKLSFKAGEKAIDLACGEGRFSYPLYLKGLEVYGLDISPNNIQIAKEKYRDTAIRFIEHDMLLPFPIKGARYVFNFYTSFGYFDTEKMSTALSHICASLEKGGILLIDYMNSEKVKTRLIPTTQITKEGIDFYIRKKIEGDYIVKSIEVVDPIKNETQRFEERVRSISAALFENLLRENGFSVFSVFGDYYLHPFSSSDSDRLILLAKKI